jgi:chromosome segregation ATPase
MLGDLSHPAVNGQLTKIRSVVKNTTSKHKDLQERLRSITDINDKLAKSYDVSLRIIVDVSKLLNQYISFFNEIESLVEGLDSEIDNQRETGEYIRYINRLTSDNIDKMTKEFRTQIDQLVPLMTKNKLDTNNLQQYGTLLENINQDAKQLIQRQEAAPPPPVAVGGGGSASKTKKKPSKKKI